MAGLLAVSSLCAGEPPRASGGAPPGASRGAPRLVSPTSLTTTSVVRIHDTRPARVAAFARRFDLWEVQTGEGYVVAALTPADYQSLRGEGITLEVDLDRTEVMLSPPGYPCYSDVDGLNARIDAIAAAHPGLAEVIDIGDSFLAEDLRLLRLTNRSVPGPKPVFYLMAAIHAREMATSELALAYAEQLAHNYGTDADATWLLDHQEIHILPDANPDGRRLADTGLYQRKNLNDTNGGFCQTPPSATNQIGTDLNRNYTFNWACCGGSSPFPCEQVFRGATAGSEPETVAVQSWIRSIFPDQRPADRTTPSPIDATGITVSLHSYSRLVLWPWGDSNGPSPNGADLSLIGGKLASFSGYVAKQSSGLYITDGITDDWVYGELGVAAFTIELGDNFFENCAALPGIVQANLRALDYVARIARAPYAMGRGPDSLQASLSMTWAEQGTGVILSTYLDETYHGGQSVSAARYYLDVPPWQGGIPLAMQPADGAFDAVIEQATVAIDTAALSPGRHMLFVEGVDAAGNAGAPRAVFLDVYSAQGVPVAGLDAVVGGVTGSLLLSWEPLSGAQSYRVAAGSLAGYYSHAVVACGAAGPAFELSAAPDDSYFLVEAVLPGPYMGGFGPDSAGVRRPPAVGACP